MNTKEEEVETEGETVEEGTSQEAAEAPVEEEKEEEVAEEEEQIEEEKPAPEKEKKEKEEEIVEERVYTVPLGRAWISPRKRHSPRAVRILRAFVMKHMKIDGDSITITNEVNERIWDRGIEKPPRKVRVRLTKNAEGIVTVHLAEGD